MSNGEAPNRFHCWCPCGNCEEFKHCNGSECDFLERGKEKP
ncbi:MAG: hypothetical protein ABFE07_15690 [Armatimonadia bacterium]